MKALLEQILEESKSIDQRFSAISSEELYAYNLDFKVPSFHPRSGEIDYYKLKVTTLAKDLFNDSQLIFADKGLAEIPFVKELLEGRNVFFEQAEEGTFKEWHWINDFIEQHKIKERGATEVIGLGGGLTMNVAAYVAELLGVALIQIPSTVIGMADGSGGKVRLNLIDKGRFYKHYYKSFYEPNQILLDPRFLDSLSRAQIATGLGEIVKHGIYQSSPLLAYLMSQEFNPEKNREALLKAILWTASLKAICLKIDVEENANGSREILRGGHELSDRIEEDSHFTVPHGTAVARGIYRELELTGSPLKDSFEKFCNRFGIMLS
jgi:3-dehydroquinate synthetase